MKLTKNTNDLFFWGIGLLTGAISVSIQSPLVFASVFFIGMLLSFISDSIKITDNL